MSVGVSALLIPRELSACKGASRGGKEWDVFVSHSTGDKPWARERIIIPLRNPPISLKVSLEALHGKQA